MKGKDKMPVKGKDKMPESEVQDLEDESTEDESTEDESTEVVKVPDKAFTTWRDSLPGEVVLGPLPELTAKELNSRAKNNGANRPTSRDVVFALMAAKYPATLAKVQPRGAYTDKTDDTIGTAHCYNVDCKHGNHTVGVSLSRFPNIGAWPTFARSIECRGCTDDRIASGDSVHSHGTTRKGTRIDGNDPTANTVAIFCAAHGVVGDGVGAIQTIIDDAATYAAELAKKETAERSREMVDLVIEFDPSIVREKLASIDPGYAAYLAAQAKVEEMMAVDA